jgi:release factor glutamine methyltransferase
MPPTLQSLLTHGKATLEATLRLDASSARIEAQMLLQHLLGVSRAHLLAHPEQVLDEAQEAGYRALLRCRLAGEPLAYILGEREFFGLTFKVTPATLIPRPETELLVELALQRIPEKRPTPQPSPCTRREYPRRERQQSCSHWRDGRGGNFRALDLGTGSGAIALAIAHARPDVGVTAVDASPEALGVAHENVRRLNIANVRLLQSDWFSVLTDERFDLIVSNPPYIAEGDAHLEEGDLRFEPRGALASGADGLDDIRRIIAQAKEHLNPGGWLLFEHGYDQARRARELLEKAGYAGVFSARDLAGIERVSGGEIS